MTNAFVTGATGLIGRWLVPLLTQRGPVTVLMRRAHERSDDYRVWVTTHGGKADAVTFVEGDLSADGLGLNAADRARVLTATDIFAAGGAMVFGMPEEVARASNVGGMAALIDIALEARARRFVHVGGYKIADGEAFREVGIAHDAPYDPALYAPLYRTLGTYEASKMQADHLVRDAARTRGLPLISIHPGGVIGDSRTGETTQFVGFSPMVEAVYYGKLPMIPGGAQHWLPLISVDFLASFMARVTEADDAVGASYTLLDDRTPMLAELVSMLAQRLGVPAPRRRIPLGVLKTLLRAKLVPGATASAEELAFISGRRHDIQSTAAMAARLGLVWPDLRAAIERNVDFLVTTRFGARAPRATARLEPVGGSRTFVYGDAREPDRVMLHGLPLDADSWDALDSLLPGHSLRADLPGLGRSAVTTASPGEWVASLVADATRPPLLIAHSLGTLYALDFACAHPDRVAGLVLISPFFLQQKPPAFMRARMTARAAGRMVRRRNLEQLVAGSTSARTLVLDGPAADLRRPGAGARFGDALAVAHAARERLTTSLREISARIPTIVIYGVRDPLVPTPDGVRVIEVADTGHFPQLDQPGVVATHIAELLASRAIARAA